MNSVLPWKLKASFLFLSFNQKQDVSSITRAAATHDVTVTRLFFVTSRTDDGGLFMRKKSVLLVCSVLVGLLARSAFSQGPPMGPPGGGPMMGGPGILSPMLMKKINLTADQQTQVHQIMENHHDTFHALFQKLEAVHEATVDKFFSAGKLTTDDFSAQTQQTTQLQEQLRNESLNMELEIRAVLTTEQLAKAAVLNENMQAMHAQMRDLLEEKP